LESPFASGSSNNGGSGGAHSGCQSFNLTPGFGGVQPRALTVARQHPLELVIAQQCDRLPLFIPVVPADALRGIQCAAVAAPPEMIAREEKIIAIEQGRVPARMARRGNSQKAFGKFHRVAALDRDLRVRL